MDDEEHNLSVNRFLGEIRDICAKYESPVCVAAFVYLLCTTAPSKEQLFKLLEQAWGYYNGSASKEVQ